MSEPEKEEAPKEPEVAAKPDPPSEHKESLQPLPVEEAAKTPQLPEPNVSEPKDEEEKVSKEEKEVLRAEDEDEDDDMLDCPFTLLKSRNIYKELGDDLCFKRDELYQVKEKYRHTRNERVRRMLELTKEDLREVDSKFNRILHSIQRKRDSIVSELEERCGLLADLELNENGERGCKEEDSIYKRLDECMQDLNRDEIEMPPTGSEEEKVEIYQWVANKRLQVAESLQHAVMAKVDQETAASKKESWLNTVQLDLNLRNFCKLKLGDMPNEILPVNVYQSTKRPRPRPKPKVEVKTRKRKRDDKEEKNGKGEQEEEEQEGADDDDEEYPGPKRKRRRQAKNEAKEEEEEEDNEDAVNETPDETWNCRDCQKTVGWADENAPQCEQCQHWYHSRCVTRNLSRAKRAVVRSKDPYSYTCATCSDTGRHMVNPIGLE